jgi:hypothetical protein
MTQPPSDDDVPSRTLTRGIGEGDGEGEGDGFAAAAGDAADGAVEVAPAGAPGFAGVDGPAGVDAGRVGSAVVGRRPQPASSTIDSTSHRVAFSTNRSQVGWAADGAARDGRGWRRLGG